VFVKHNADLDRQQVLNEGIYVYDNRFAKDIVCDAIHITNEHHGLVHGVFSRRKLMIPPIKGFYEDCLFLVR
jgi:hypothetical protein